MLYHLLYALRHEMSALNVVRYLTFRTAVASLTALFLVLILGPWMIDRLRLLQIGQYIREEGPQAHKKKAGTPTMGGLLILTGIVVPVLLWSDLTNRNVWILLLSTLAFGAIGFADDYLKVVKKRSLGLRARSKMGLQIVAGLALGLAVYCSGPRCAHPILDPGDSALLQVGDAGAGLSSTSCSPACLVVGLQQRREHDRRAGRPGHWLHIDRRRRLYRPRLRLRSPRLLRVPGPALLAQGRARSPSSAEPMVGASMGFLWWNCYPAQIFMGDVGSLSLGGALATVAILIKQELLLVAVGGLFVVETLSVILQVASFRLRGKRIFRMAPLHHHFELMGWAEPQIIIRFLIVAFVFALFAITTLKLR